MYSTAAPLKQTDAPPADLQMALQFVKGVGPQRAGQLERKGLRTVEDALFFVPLRHEDRTQLTPFRALVPGQPATCSGVIVGVSPPPPGRSRVPFTVMLRDASGYATASWFGWRYLARVLKRGQRLVLHGRVGRYKGATVLQQPDYEIVENDGDERLHTGRLVPVYSLTEGLPQRALRSLMWRLVDAFAPTLPEVLPDGVRQRRRLVGLAQAIREAHFPETDDALAAARHRIAFDEGLLLQLGLAILRSRVARARGVAMNPRGDLVARLRAALPWKLTGAQERVWDEIRRDMAAPYPMHRLLQGDVGSGKTIVAALGVLTAVESGHQAAVMAPTEILAEQHFMTFRQLLEPLGVPVTLLTSSLKPRERAARRAALAEGEIGCAVGTHALVQEGVAFRRLGLVVVDEQHRFGVEQRAALVEKGDAPDVLLLTATPIPRSLALTLYGDLDVTQLRERPPGRGTVKTALRTDAARSKIYEFIRSECAAGRQAYVIYPVIDESERADLKAATTMAAKLAKTFADFRVGLVHGKLKADERDATMRAFRDNSVQILVATTVIEVGIDVANATVMLIEHAERFGLAQLHQLRGRVGRGAAASHCILLSDSPEAAPRLQAFCETTDGFKIAELDLHERGMGELTGARQSGGVPLRYANLETDLPLLDAARTAAAAMIATDPALERREHAVYRERIVTRYERGFELFRVG